MATEFNGLHRMIYDPEYRDSHKHNHNQKIVQMAMTGAIAIDAEVRVHHQLTCSLLYSRKAYCDCDPMIYPKPKVYGV